MEEKKGKTMLLIIHKKLAIPGFKLIGLRFSRRKNSLMLLFDFPFTRLRFLLLRVDIFLGRIVCGLGFLTLLHQ